MRRSNTLASHLFADGHEFEVECLGRCQARYSGYLSWTEAAEQVRKHQPAKKTKMVAALEREFERRGVPARFCTAVGSAMDYHHGVDGYFDFCGVMVTLDVTKNAEKTVGKADVVVHPDDLADIPVLAARIGREFIAKMQKEERR